MHSNNMHHQRIIDALNNNNIVSQSTITDISYIVIITGLSASLIYTPHHPNRPIYICCTGFGFIDDYQC